MRNNNKTHIKKHKATYITGISLGTVITVATPLIVSEYKSLEDKVSGLTQTVMTREEIAKAINNAIDIYRQESPSKDDIKQAIADLQKIKTDNAITNTMIKNIENRLKALENGGN